MANYSYTKCGTKCGVVIGPAPASLVVPSTIPIPTTTLGSTNAVGETLIISKLVTFKTND